MRRLIPYLIVAALLAGSVVAYGELARPDTPSPTAEAAGRSSHQLHVRGHVQGLYPGAAQRMRVGVRNGYPHDVVLRKVSAIVRDGGPGCARQNLWTRRFRGNRRITAHHSRSIRIAIGLQIGAPEACQGARFPLRFRARARAAGR
jgi:hypothetical protein